MPPDQPSVQLPKTINLPNQFSVLLLRKHFGLSQSELLFQTLLAPDWPFSPFYFSSRSATIQIQSWKRWSIWPRISSIGVSNTALSILLKKKEKVALSFKVLKCIGKFFEQRQFKRLFSVFHSGCPNEFKILSLSKKLSLVISKTKKRKPRLLASAGWIVLKVWLTYQSVLFLMRFRVSRSGAFFWELPEALTPDWND